MLPEWKYNQIAKVKFWLNKILKKVNVHKNNLYLIDNKVEILKQLVIAVDDLTKFYGIKKEELFLNIENWVITEKKLYEKSKNLVEFYKVWTNDAAIQNACANVFNQLIWFENYSVVAGFATKSNVIIDYGCGTATLSLALVLNGRIKGSLILLDIINDVSKFVKFRIVEHKLTNVVMEDIFVFDKKNFADLVICIDVLEHIEDSSNVFTNKIYPTLKSGGYLILRAPWRGQLTHIDQAADDFYLNGGRKFLSKNFKEIYRFGSLDICAVYQKK